MATRFERFRAYFSGRSCAPCARGHSHLACLAIKLAILLLLGCGALALSATSAQANSFVEFDYNIYSLSNRSRSSVFVQLYDDRPLTTANFLQYINGGLYNNSLMHRLAFYQSTGAPFVLQGGGFYPSYITEPPPLNTSLNPAVQVDLDGNPATNNPTVASEFNNAPLRSNVKGTIAMYLNSTSPNSATNQYFFNLSDNSTYLDFTNGGYTVFAQVAGDGMALIDKYVTDSLIINLNPDTNHNSIRDDAGPFGELPAATLSVGGVASFLPLTVTKAKVVDYLGSGFVTDVPASGLTFANKDAFIDTGASFTGTGAITVGVGRTLGMREAYALNRSLVNHGTVAPGLSLGVIGVNSTYFQFSDGTLAIQLAGTTVDTQYDRLISSSTAFLAGKLQVSFLNNFAPVAGNSFTVLTAQSIVGGFTAFDLPQLTPGLVWNINQSTTAVTLTAIAADFNKDGIVDARDYTYWRKTNGSPIDYQLWRSNIGNRSGGAFFAGSSDAGGLLSNGNIPEPSSGILAVTAGMLLSGLRRRRVGRCGRSPILRQFLK